MGLVHPPPSTLRRLFFARLLDSLHSTRPESDNPVVSGEEVNHCFSAVLCLPPTPSMPAAGCWRPLCVFLLLELPMPCPLHTPPGLPSWPVLFCILAGQHQGPEGSGIGASTARFFFRGFAQENPFPTVPVSLRYSAVSHVYLLLKFGTLSCKLKLFHRFSIGT